VIILLLRLIFRYLVDFSFGPHFQSRFECTHRFSKILKALYMTAQNDFESVDDFKFIVLDGDFFKQIFQQFSVSSGINLFLREIKFQLFQRKKV